MRPPPRLPFSRCPGEKCLGNYYLNAIDLKNTVSFSSCCNDLCENKSPRSRANESFTSGSYQRNKDQLALPPRGKWGLGYGLGAPGHRLVFAALAPPFRDLPRSARPANSSELAAEK